MHLDWNSVVLGAMNKYGEVLWRQRNQQHSDIAWLVTVCRLEIELGLHVSYRGGGMCVLVAPLKWKIATEKGHRFLFINYMVVQKL